jgi:hypothetical protein
VVVQHALQLLCNFFFPNKKVSNRYMKNDDHAERGSASSGAPAAAAAGGGGVRAPEGEMAIVFSDITRAASLWEYNAEAMRDATLLHNNTLRSLLTKHHGYEVVFLR